MESDSIAFAWEETQDPDLYDQVVSHFLLTKDSLKIASALQSIENGEMGISQFSEKDGFIANETPTKAAFSLSNPGGGDYYWAVIASDKDGHLSFAERNGKRIAHFHIPLPDLIVKDIEFDYDHVINESEKQGVLRIIVENIGETWAKNISFSLRDVVVPIKNPPQLPLRVHNSFHTIPKLMPGQSDTITIDWYRASSGLCEIAATVDFENKIPELQEENNRTVESFYTIPKGKFAAPDTSNILLTSRVIIELPFINEICMDAESTKVKYPYLHYTTFDGPLDVLVKRLDENRNFSVSLVGYADPNSEKGLSVNGTRVYAGPIVDQKKSRAIFINPGFAQSLEGGTAAFAEPLFNLAYRRSLAVRDSLEKRGVLPTQIRIDSVKVWKKRYVPSDTTDARWIFEERREVTISTDTSAQNTLFAPVPRIDNEGLKPPVKFASEIKSVLPLSKGDLIILVPRDSDSLNFDLALAPDSLEGDTVRWNLHLNDSTMVASMVNREAIYHIAIKDSLGRVFWNEPQQTFLRQGTFLRDHKISFPLQFAGTSPMYGLYWARILKLAEELFDDPYMHMRFEGHACATGPEAINLTLSIKRANAFYDKFLTFLGTLSPADSAKIAGRLDPPRGYGESRPLKIDRLDKRKKSILIGDNNSPIGRKFNRRIEIIFYSKAKKPRFIY
ncbi:MAG: hypothetical protein GXO75_20205 [Calditrichaeota bacterium]|nr:hypothetical protein [Calditrichota bacterium]